MVTMDDHGVARFRLYLGGAERVQILGTFTGWHDAPVELRREEEAGGWWTADVGLAAGDHEFQYLVDGSAWLADYGAHGIQRNRWGLWTSLLHVPERVEEPVPQALPFPEQTASRAAA